MKFISNFRQIVNIELNNNKIEHFDSDVVSKLT